MAGRQAWRATPPCTQGCSDPLSPTCCWLVGACNKNVSAWLNTEEFQAEGLEEALSDQTLCLAALLEAGSLEKFALFLSSAPWLPNSRAALGL